MGDVVSKTNYDFAGWVTKNNLRCADGIVICQDAFSYQDGEIVPLVYNHNHDSIEGLLGHTLLENRPEGVYGYSLFNNTPSGQHAKEAVQHGDVKSMSIWANNLDKDRGNVRHGVIREVSLVLAGANPGAMVESVVRHGMSIDDDDEEGILYTGDELELYHAAPDEIKMEEEDKKVADKKEEKQNGKTVEEVFETLNEDQKKAVAIIVGQAIQDARGDNDDEDDEEDDDMKHNVFDNDGVYGRDYISHVDQEMILQEAKERGSLRKAWDNYAADNDVIIHSLDTTGMTVSDNNQTYMVNDPDFLFPEYRSLNNPPEWISRNMDWVSKVMSGVHRTPFSRIKSQYADITEDEARAKGYIKGKQKKDEVFTLLKRTTDPQTIYKRQKMDRNDIIDITDFDVVSWIRAEMRVMLNEEIARAILIGDGRPSDSDDKIQALHVRPIVSDVPLFNTVLKVTVPTNASPAEIAKETINTIIRGKKHYKGSGNPTFWTYTDPITEMLLMEDGIGHKLYKTQAELTTALRVKDIVEVEPMEGQTVSISGTEYPLIGVIVNLSDYNVGADKGGEINMFDDFDIDFNQYKYLIETRLSGALIKPFSALTVVLDKGGAAG